MSWLKAFAISLALFMVLDFVWLGFLMKSFNLRQLAELGRIQDGRFDVLLLPALFVYVFMATFVVVFILPKLPPGSSTITDFLTGALAGLLVYGIFDMTNMAILNRYPLAFSLVDMAWGTFLFGFVTVIVKKFA